MQARSRVVGTLPFAHEKIGRMPQIRRRPLRPEEAARLQEYEAALVIDDMHELATAIAKLTDVTTKRYR